MATRKTAPKGRKPRPGLRSQMKKVTMEDVAWNSAETTEEEEVAAGLPDTSRKSRSPRTKPITPVATAGEGMVSLMRQFLDAQQQREERYLQELRGLRDSILQSTYFWDPHIFVHTCMYSSLWTVWIIGTVNKLHPARKCCASEPLFLYFHGLTFPIPLPLKRVVFKIAY